MDVGSTFRYAVDVLEPLDGTLIPTLSPVTATVENGERSSTRITLTTDQSGLIGFLRSIHHQDIVISGVTMTGGCDATEE